METAAAVRAHGVEAEAIRADFTDEAHVTLLEKKVAARFGRIQILINNAGINIRKNVTDFALVEWRSVLDTKLTGVFLLSRAFLRLSRGIRASQVFENHHGSPVGFPVLTNRRRHRECRWTKGK